MTKTKHVPQRTCVGCRTTSDKRAFVRAVRTPEGAVEVDESGRKNGRGAYLCERRDCWEEAIRRDRLARALRTTIAPAQRDELLRYAERFEATTIGSTS